MRSGAAQSGASAGMRERVMPAVSAAGCMACAARTIRECEIAGLFFHFEVAGVEALDIEDVVHQAH